ncbi:hypothetical protein [Streptomyces sp. NPDC049040]|uniref:hypothetical protein n=1 Tax=Streptomyces sp. NPDC049040 TaxID=3365593 RepID=UPI0037188AC9
MYEYDIYQMMGPEGFAPRLGRLPDSFPEAEAEPEPEDTRTQWDFDAEFEHLFKPIIPGQAAPVESPPAAPRVHRRRRRPLLVRLRRPATLGVCIATITAGVAAGIGVLGAMVSYGPLRQLASPTAHGLAGSWPLLVFGPWLAGCLSILHAAAHRRSGRTGWIAVVLFSVIAMALCIAHAPRTIIACATAGLPPFSALATFLLLSRQIALLRPGRAKPRRRRKH